MSAPLTQRTLIVLAGPTASGKTAAAIRLAQAYACPIISADARQFYKEIPIGTATPTAEEQALAQHFFVAHMSVHEHIDAGTFAEQTIALLETLFLQHTHVILCGGSGLFIKAVTHGLDTLPEVPAEIREQVRSLYSEHGLERLQKEVANRDPEYYAIVDKQNPQRLMRALEICLATGTTYSSFRKQNAISRNFSAVSICIDLPRTELYNRINARVDQMMALGLLDEARSVYSLRHLPALQTVGYRELFAHFYGQYDLPTAVDLIKQHTRNYAKRQLTWFRNTGGYTMLHTKDINKSTVDALISQNHQS